MYYFSNWTGFVIDITNVFGAPCNYLSTTVSTNQSEFHPLPNIGQLLFHRRSTSYVCFLARSLSVALSPIILPPICSLSCSKYFSTTSVHERDAISCDMRHMAVPNVWYCTPVYKGAILVTEKHMAVPNVWCWEALN